MLLLHGATVPSWEYQRLAPSLYKHNLRTIAFDFYGHGSSDRPQVRYELSLFSQQLAALLEACKIDDPVHLVGHSLGAAVASRFAIDTQQAASISLVGPLIDFTENFPASSLLKWPVIGEALVFGFVVPMLRRRRAKNYAGVGDGLYPARFNQQLEIPGFERALLSMFRCDTLSSQEHLYRELDVAIRRRKLNVQILRAEQDQIVSNEQVARLRKWLPAAHYQGVPGCGHPFMLTHPERAAPLLVEFIKGLGQ